MTSPASKQMYVFIHEQICTKSRKLTLSMTPGNSGKALKLYYEWVKHWWCVRNTPRDSPGIVMICSVSSFNSWHTWHRKHIAASHRLKATTCAVFANKNECACLFIICVQSGGVRAGRWEPITSGHSRHVWRRVLVPGVKRGTYNRPLAIWSPDTHVNARYEQGLRHLIGTC